MTLFALRVGGMQQVRMHSILFHFEYQVLINEPAPYTRSDSPQANVLGLTRTTRRQLPDDLYQRIARTGLYDPL